MRAEFWLLFGFGLTFLATRLVLAVRFPYPTVDQQGVFRTVLSLSAAGVAAVIPGLAEFESQVATTTISATGALGVFVLVYLFDPGSVRNVMNSRGRNESHKHRPPEWAVSLSSQVEFLNARLTQLESAVQRGGSTDNSIRTDRSRQEGMEKQAVGRETLLREIDRAEEEDGLVAELASTRPKTLVPLALGLVLVLVLLLASFGLLAIAPSDSRMFIIRLVFSLAGALLGAMFPSIFHAGAGSLKVLLAFSSSIVLLIIIYFISGVLVA